MGKLDGKVAVITGATSGMALASAKLFVEEGAYVFITGRRQENLNEAVKAIGRNVTGVQGDSAKLADLDRLYETVKREKGYVDVVFASAGQGGRAPLGTITEEQFDTIFSLNSRGTLFTEPVRAYSAGERSCFADVERRLASFKGTEAALHFSSGYAVGRTILYAITP